MNPILMVMGLTAMIPLCMFGTMKLTEIYQQIMLVRQGYVKVDFTRSNGRQIVKFSKPADGVNVIEGQTYPFNDHPSYMVQESGILGTVPKISVDSKSAKQMKLRDPDSKDVNPQIMTGAGKLAYLRGQNDASTDLKALKNLVIIGVVCSILAAVSTFLPMILPKGG